MANDTDRPGPIPNRSTTARGFVTYDEFIDIYANLDAGMARRVVAALTAWLEEIGTRPEVSDGE